MFLKKTILTVKTWNIRECFLVIVYFMSSSWGPVYSIMWSLCCELFSVVRLESARCFCHVVLFTRTVMDGTGESRYQVYSVNSTSAIQYQRYYLCSSPPFCLSAAPKKPRIAFSKSSSSSIYPVSSARFLFHRSSFMKDQIIRGSL